MKDFLFLRTPQDALAQFLDQIRSEPIPEAIKTEDGLGRILAEAIVAPFSLPAFPRATVDGYAVGARDTFGASESLPLYLKIAGEVGMGYASHIALEPGSCALIYTGGMLPDGADAVVMVEHTQITHAREIELLRPVAQGENAIQVGEDVREGAVVIPRGAGLRAAEIGGLMALGITSVRVARRPRIGIISSGDEVVPPGSDLRPGQIFDINTYSLSSLVTESGALAISYGIAADTFVSLMNLAESALRECDMVLLTAGSSLSTRDLTARVINALGDPGVLVHGVNIRPGKPTILGVCQGKPVIGLPGNPASALIIGRLFAVPAIEALQGIEIRRPKSAVDATLLINVNSAAGREDFIPVRLVRSLEGWEAEPVFGKSNLIFALVRADGLLRIPPDVTGYIGGERVTVELL